MPWGAAAAVAAAVITSSAQSDAASSAAESQAQSASQANATQAKAAADANATQRYMYDTTRADNAPFLANGTSANNRLAYLMGLNPAGTSQSAGTALTRDQIRSSLLPQYTRSATPSAPSETWSFVDGPGGYDPNPFGMDSQNATGLWRSSNGTASMGIPSSYFRQLSASQQASGQQQSSVDEIGLTDAVNAQLQKQTDEQNAANAAANAAAQNDPAYGSLLRKFSIADRDADPVYQSGLQFGLDQGAQGINRQFAAQGSLNSGATLKALTRFANDYGTTKAAGAYDRYNNDNSNTYNRLAGLSGTGQTASGVIGSAGQNYANQFGANTIGAGNAIANNQIGVGNARAASSIGSANAWAGGLSNAYNGYQQNRLMNMAYAQPSNNANYDSNGGFGSSEAPSSFTF